MRKNHLGFLLFWIFAFAASGEAANIKILYTSALIPEKFQQRKWEYIQSLQLLMKYGLIQETYVIESGPKIPGSFFEKYCPHVFYSGTNDTRLRNKGVNEAKSLIRAYNYYSFSDSDLLIKLTGRYRFVDQKLFKFFITHPKTDAVVSYHDNDLQGKFQTGCFVMRGRYFKAWLQQLDLQKMETVYSDIEWEMTYFIEKMISEGANVQVWDKIGIKANVFNRGMRDW